MRVRSFHVVLAAAGLMLLPSLAPGQPAPSTIDDRWPSVAPPRRDAETPPAPPKSPPRRAPAPEREAPAAPAAPAPKPEAATPAATPRPAAPTTAVVCSGVFAKDSSHRKLALRYDSRNITYTDVDGPDGTKIKASVLFPTDPKRRLEVLWSNDTDRSDTSVIVITGRSQWTAPKGLKLGLPLDALEKANGRPFKLSGFGPDRIASVLGWQGGTLGSLPGGCKIGVRLVSDRKAPDAARNAVAGERELPSSDGALRAVKPTVSEILIGY
jgi:hypothetical protein